MRLYHLTKQSLWLDEVFTLHVAQLSFPQILNFTLSSLDIHPPLFYIFEHVALTLFGLTPFALRILPAIFGTITIPIFYLIGKELTNNKPFGLLLSGLLTITTFHIYHSQDARMYSLYLLLFSIGLFFFLRAYNTGKIIHILISCVTFALCVYTHYTGIYVGGFFLLLAIALKNKKFIYGMILYILIILPILPTIITSALLTPDNPFYIESGRTSAFVGIDAITRTLTYLLGSSSFSLPLFMLSVGGAIYLMTRDRRIGTTLLSFFVISLTIAGITSYKLPVEPRHFIYLLPILLIYVAFGFEYIYTLIRTRYYKIPAMCIAIFIVICILLINTPMLTFYYTENTKSDYSGLSQKVSNITTNKNIVLLIPGGTQKVFDLYYNSTEDQTSVYYINNIADFERALSTKYTCCSCNKSCVPWKLIVITTSDIKYDQNKNEYRELLTKSGATHIETYDSFEIYEIR